MNTKDWKWVDRASLKIDHYDKAVSENKRSIYAYSFYFDAVAKKWGAYIKGDYEDVFPLAYTDYLTVKVAYVPNFQGVSFFTQNEEETKLFQQLLKNDWKYYDLQIIQTRGETTGRNFQTIDFDHPEKYSTNAKRLIKKATKEGYSVQFDNNWVAVYSIFEKVTFEKIDGLQKSDLPYFQQLLQALDHNNKLEVITLYMKNQIVGGGFFIPSANRIIYLKGAATTEAMKSGGMYFMMDSAIQHYKDTYPIFDFGGSAVPQVAEFNRKLGGQNKKTVSLQSRALPSWYKAARKIYRTLKK